MSSFEARISLQRSRFHLIQQATEYDNDDVVFPATIQFVNARLELLDENWQHFREEHVDLCRSGSRELTDHRYIRNRMFERCQEFYVLAKAKLRSQKDELESIRTINAGTSSATMDSNVPPRSSRQALEPSDSLRSSRTTSDSGESSRSFRRLRALPKITLPHFSGELQEWRNFHDLFSSMIRTNAELSDVERMHYLKTSLSGDALKFVTNLPVSGDSFAIAWDTLVSRYENKRFLISSHLDRLTSLKPLKTKAASGLSALLASVTEARGALRALGCHVDYWDPILLHLLVKLLDADSREAWEVKLGSSTNYPTFSQFEDFIIGRSQAMQHLSQSHQLSNNSKEHSSRHDRSDESSHRHGSRVHVGSSAPSMSYSHCPLCDSSHSLASCPTYQSKNINQRYELIAKHRRCFNCLGAHALRACRTTRRCLKCGKQHHTSIHPGKTSQTQGEKTAAFSQVEEKESTPEDSAMSSAE